MSRGGQNRRMRGPKLKKIAVETRVDGSPPPLGVKSTFLRGVSEGSKMTLGRGGSIYPGFYGDFFQFRTPRTLILGVENDVEGSSFMVVVVSQLGIVVLISAVVEIIGTRHLEFMAWDP